MHRVPEGYAVKSGKWEISQEAGASPKNLVLAQVAASATSVFNVVLLQSAVSRLRDVELTVRLRSVRGKVDQGGGLVWRARDERNYYITRYNPLENNLRLYTVKSGRRRMLRSARVAKDRGAWRLLRVRVREDHVQVFLDDEKQLDHRDSTFREAGYVGLWTKADAVTYFDDLQVEPL